MHKGRLHYGWVIIFTSNLVILSCLGLARFGYGMLLPAMQEGLGLGNVQAGMVASADLLAYLAFSLIGGALATRYGARRVISFGLALFIAVLRFFARSPAFIHHCGERGKVFHFDFEIGALLVAYVEGFGKDVHLDDLVPDTFADKLVGIDNQFLDVFGGLAGTLGQSAYFGGHNGKPSAGFTCPCGLDRGIECQQIGLEGDFLDQADDFRNLT